jgi:hypothetical protein
MLRAERDKEIIEVITKYFKECYDLKLTVEDGTFTAESLKEEVFQSFPKLRDEAKRDRQVVNGGVR